MKRTFLTNLLAAVLAAAAAQQPVSLVNPSFEGRMAHSQTPEGWKNCGDPSESPPDIQPDITFGVRQPSLHGRSYVGMVARDNNTSECIYQDLVRPLAGGQCYRLSLYASRSDIYQSQSRLTGQPANFNQPLMLNIWGGAQADGKMTLLGVVGPVWHTEWVEYNVELWVNESCNWLYLEADFTGNTPYNGNVLIDNLSALTPIPCTDSLANFVSFGPVDEQNMPLPIDTLRFVTYESEEALRKYLRMRQPDMRFGADGRLNSRLYYLNGRGSDADGGALFRSNAYFHELAHAAAQLGYGERVVVWVNGIRDEAKPRADHLKNLLYRLNLENALTIDYGRAPSKRINWLAENEWVKIGIKD